MADEVVHHVHEEGGKNNMGFVVGIVLLIVFAIIFILYIMPALGGALQQPQVNVPDKIDVNINQPGS